MTLRCAALVLVLVLTGAAGCGMSEEDRVRETISKHFTGWHEGDAEAVCSTTSAAERNDGPLSCEETVRVVGGPHPGDGDPDQSLRLARGDWRIRIDGSRATATGENLGRLRLVKEDGTWKLDS